MEFYLCRCGPEVFFITPKMGLDGEKKIQNHYIKPHLHSVQLLQCVNTHCSVFNKRTDYRKNTEQTIVLQTANE